jgi:hypothetical protein
MMPNYRIALSRAAILRLLDGHPVQVPTAEGPLEFEAIHTEWQPLTKHDYVPEQIRHAMHAEGLHDEIEIWSNDIYEVFGRLYGPNQMHLSIKRYDRAPIRNWRHFQQIKNEVCGPESEAVELYPAESRLVDNANQYHLWVMLKPLPPGAYGELKSDDTVLNDLLIIPRGEDGILSLGFPVGLTLTDSEVADYNSGGEQNPTGKGRQEPVQPGLTTGETMKRERESALHNQQED